MDKIIVKNAGMQKQMQALVKNMKSPLWPNMHITLL